MKLAFVTLKTKLGPLKKAITIPRMELQVAVLAAPLRNSLRKEAKFEISNNIWFDSEIVLYFLKSQPICLIPYESVRVQEILE